MKTKADGFIRLQLALPFVQRVRDMGKDPAPALKALALDEKMMNDPTATVHAEIVYGLTNALAEVASDPYLGCHVAESTDVTQWPPAAEAMRDAKTVGEVLIRFVTLVPQSSSAVSYAVGVEDTQAIFSARQLIRTSNKPVQTHGFGIAVYVQFLKVLVGDNWDARRVFIRAQHPESVPNFYQGLRIRRIEGPEYAMVFPTAWLLDEVSITAKSPAVPEPEVVPDLSIVAALRNAARPLLANRALGANEVAAALGLSANRLQAALRLHGTTVPRELKRLRVDAAREALAEGDAPVSDIARDLGYHDQSHFTRFFRSQVGETPSSIRAKALSSSTKSTQKHLSDTD